LLPLCKVAKRPWVGSGQPAILDGLPGQKIHSRFEMGANGQAITQKKKRPAFWLMPRGIGRSHQKFRSALMQIEVGGPLSSGVERYLIGKAAFRWAQVYTAA
jgi:hypothetical protein